MNRLTSSILAATMAFSVGISGLIPANAAPISAPRIAADNGAINIQMSRAAQEFTNWPEQRRMRRGDRHWRGDGVRHGGYYRGDGYYNGYRGFRHRRPGHRYHNGLWFPAGAFIAGAIIGGALNNPAPRYSERRYIRRGGGNAHVSWCYDRYRSYRASDNTFQPYNGPRQQCYSPYS